MLTLAFLGAVPAACLAANLDSPLPESQPTIRSELMRGHRAADLCDRLSGPLAAGTSYDTCLQKISNEQADRFGSPGPFNAGLYITALMLTDIDAGSWSSKGSGGGGWSSIAKLEYQRFQDAASGAGLTVDDVCAAVFNCVSVKPVLAKYR